MIRVTVELIPPDRRRPSRQLAVMEIANSTGTGNDSDLADYVCRYITVQPNGDKSIQQWAAEGFRRLEFNVWGLIMFSLAALGGEHILADGTPPVISYLQGDDLLDELRLLTEALGGR